MGDERLEQGPQIAIPPVGGRLGDTGLGVGIDDREVELLFRGVEIDEEVVDLVQDLGGAGVAAVDLVDDDDRRQPRLERLAQDVARLGKGALRGVHEEEHAVDHLERALHLAPEVTVPGRVDDVDLGVPVAHRGVLGQDRDAALALEVVRVHHPIRHLLVGPEGAALPEHGVDEGRLAVVDVGDDRDVA